MAWTITDPVNSVTVASLPGHIRAVKTGILDEDDMVSDSATDVASQQSIKAFVTTGIVSMTNKTLTSVAVDGTGVTLAAGADLIGSSTSDITINTDKFTVAGDTGNTVIAGTCDITGALVASTSIDINGTVVIVGTLDEDDMASADDTTLATSESIKAYVDSASAADSIIKGWVTFPGTGANGAKTPSSSYNCAGVNKDATGTYTISWTTDFGSTNYCTVGTTNSQAGGMAVVSIETRNVGSTVIHTNQQSSAALVDPDEVHLIAIGAQ